MPEGGDVRPSGTRGPSPAHLVAMAEMLARLISVGENLLPVPALEYYRYAQGDPWPRPHSSHC